ncbi:unnamed protein product [Polarella glacialis]|uniref:Uncharacterized protein n=1 Tax=Polarella glacialis TaxID=89957 RepID=A0A813K4J4_POLGL|nr:unnamed protein product [Polarella glacialis]|mmetsp:Transcript_53333/g.86260  ORF Transcript_53333/g.86260 Transcript_53333/m.86260 type:complete len:174 (-) Transcript_53333:51-572(-)
MSWRELSATVSSPYLRKGPHSMEFFREPLYHPSASGRMLVGSASVPDLQPLAVGLGKTVAPAMFGGDEARHYWRVAGGKPLPERSSSLPIIPRPGSSQKKLMASTSPDAMSDALRRESSRRRQGHAHEAHVRRGAEINHLIGQWYEKGLQDSGNEHMRRRPRTGCVRDNFWEA